MNVLGLADVVDHRAGLDDAGQPHQQWNTDEVVVEALDGFSNAAMRTNHVAVIGRKDNVDIISPTTSLYGLQDAPDGLVN